MIWNGAARRDKRHGMAQRPSEKSFSFIPWTLIPPWHATDSLFNVYSVVCPADRYLVNQWVSCPCSNSCHHPLPVAALFALLPSPSTLLFPRLPPFFAHLFFHSRTRSPFAARETRFIGRNLSNAFARSRTPMYVRSEIASRLDSWLRDCEDDFTLRDSTFNWNFFLEDYAVRQYWWDVFNAFVANVALEPSVHARIDIYVNRILIILVTFSKLDKFINCIDAYRVICTHEKYMILFLYLYHKYYDKIKML